MSKLGKVVIVFSDKCYSVFKLQILSHDVLFVELQYGDFIGSCTIFCCLVYPSTLMWKFLIFKKKKIKQSRVSAKIHFLTAYEHHKPSRIPFLDMNGSEREKYFKIFNIFLNQFFVSYPGHLKPLKCKCYLCVQMSSIIESGECIHVYLKTKYFGILLKISTKLVSSNYFLPKLWMEIYG